MKEKRKQKVCERGKDEAVPHAGLGFQFLRVHVRTTDPGGLQEEVGPKEKSTSDEPTR